MNPIYRWGTVLCALVLTTSLFAQTFVAKMTGRMEVPVVNTLASGDLTAVLEPVTSTLTVSGSFDNLSSDFDASIGAHLHLGLAGQNGGVQFPLVPTVDADQRGGIFVAADNVFTLTADQITALTDRLMYVNIHTMAYPGGEIRGQLTPGTTDAVFTAGLYGPNEVPPVATMGEGRLVLDLTGDQLTVSGRVSNLSSPLADIAGGAHLHIGLPGTNGGVDIVLNATTDADGNVDFFQDQNTFTVTADQIAMMQNRMYYANIHTENFPTGEVRGQVVGQARVLFRAAMSGGFEVPMVNTLARGQILGELGDDDIRVFGNFVGLESDFAAAHLHNGFAGRNGGVLVGLAADTDADNAGGQFTVASNTYPVTDDLANSLINRGIYLNIHSADNPAGETRGQMLPEAQTVLTAIASSAQSNPDNTSSGTGQVKLEIVRNSVVMSGGFQDLTSAVDVNIAGGMHLHVAPAGSNGPVAIIINADLEGDQTSGTIQPEMNRFDVTDGLRDSIMARFCYFNLHTLDHPSGEIRGQYLIDAANYVIAPLSGASETSPVNTEARGMLVGEIFPGRVTMTGSFNGLESDFDLDLAGGAHLHTAPAGSNGDIIFLLDSEAGDDNRSAVFPAMDNVFPFGMDTLQMFRERGIYANVHSIDQPAGEIRGQVMPVSQAVFHGTFDGLHELPLATTTATGGIKAEVRGNMLFVSGSFNGLTSEFDASVAGGAHLHIAPATGNGPIAFLLTAEVADDSLSGRFFAADNAFELTDAQLANLFDYNYYANIHTKDFPAGELRAQLVSDPNSFPNADAEIIAPADGAMILLEGSSSTEINVDWTDATDPDNDSLSYVWELASDPNFNNVLLQFSTGGVSELSFTQGLADSLLAANGITVGVTLNFYHRVITTDGSNETRSGAGELVEITSGVVIDSPNPDAELYRARLTGRMEIPVVNTLASGEVNALLDTVNNVLTVEGGFGNLSSDFNTDIGAHLHLGIAGQNGPVQFPLVIDLDADLRGGTFNEDDNSFTLTDAQEAAVLDRAMYVNVHTLDYPGGEIRGQILPIGDAVFSAGLYGPNEVPPVATMGEGRLVLDLIGDQLTVTGRVSNLSSPLATNVAGGAHLHIGLPGMNGGVDIVLNATVDADGNVDFLPADNTFTVTDDQATMMENRMYYANIHTENFPMGEVRGQVVGQPRVLFRSALSGGFGVPITPSLARGQILGELGDDDIRVFGNFVGLNSPLAVDIANGAHLHDGMAGRTGPVLVPLNATLTNMDSTAGQFLVADNTYDLTDDLTERLMARGIYLNIHSAMAPMGETRGQMLPEAQVVLTAIATGAQEIPDVVGPGAGQVKLEIVGNTATISGGFQNLGSDVNTDIAGGMHLHTAPAGSNGPVAIIINSEFDDGSARAGILPVADNRFDISDGLRDSIMMRLTYFNLHTLDNAPGEIRGQFMLDAGNYVLAPLGGASETDPVDTEARGLLIGELFPGRVSMTGSFNGLESDFNTAIAGGAHLHTAPAGSNGDVLFLLNSDIGDDNRSAVFPVMDNVIMLEMDTFVTLRRRGLYANIHSIDNAPGEIRGQVMPISESLLHGSFSGINEVPVVMTSGRGSVKAEISGNRLTVHGSFGDLTTPFDPNIAGGAHLHLAAAGNNGDVIFPLTPQLAADNLSGRFLPGQNRFMLTDEQREAFYAYEMYANIHTEGNAPGEIRAQVVSDPNAFPNADAAITAPADGASIDLEGSPSAELFIDWTEATDDDNETLAYVWQLAADEDFNTILFMTATGNATGLVLTQGVVDTLLMTAGVMVGNSATLFHRAVATDGSNHTPGESATVTINRGVVTNTRNPLADNFSMTAFPTPVRQADVTVEISGDQVLPNAQLIVTDLVGRLIDVQPTPVTAGQQQYQVPTAGLAAGTYLIQLRSNDRLVVAKRIVVQ